MYGRRQFFYHAAALAHSKYSASYTMPCHPLVSVLITDCVWRMQRCPRSDLQARAEDGTAVTHQKQFRSIDTLLIVNAVKNSKAMLGASVVWTVGADLFENQVEGTRGVTLGITIADTGEIAKGILTTRVSGLGAGLPGNDTTRVFAGWANSEWVHYSY
eukprot:scaffold2044_cov206-Cylindrotheca_fusiformis.AAC.2